MEVNRLGDELNTLEKCFWLIIVIILLDIREVSIR